MVTRNVKKNVHLNCEYNKCRGRVDVLGHHPDCPFIDSDDEEERPIKPGGCESDEDDEDEDDQSSARVRPFVRALPENSRSGLVTSTAIRSVGGGPSWAQIAKSKKPSPPATSATSNVLWKLYFYLRGLEKHRR